MNMRWLLATILAMQAGWASTPSGIFCSCGPTTAHSHSVTSDIAALSFVNGVLLRVAWSDLEPAQGNRDWTLLDNELQLAHQAGKTVALGIVNGSAAPSWVRANGAAMFSTTFGGIASSIPIPWDPVYLAAWQSFVAVLGARYNNQPDIVLVHMTNSTANGFEMQLPFAPPDLTNWTTAGYTAQKNIDSWKSVLDAFAAAFPNKPLDVEVHPVLNSDQVAQSVVSYGQSSIGSRFGVFSAWWSRQNATTAYPGMYQLILNGVASSYSAAQMVSSQVQTPSFQLSDAISFALASGVRYMEIWNQDLVATQLQTLLKDTAAALATNSVTVESAASGQGPTVAAGSIASAFGTALANQTASSATQPSTLGGVTVMVKDSSGNLLPAGLFATSPTQINFLVPPTATIGPATISIANTVTSAVSTGSMQISSIAPGAFSANGNGSGVAAAQVLTLHADGTQTTQLAFQCSGGKCSAIGISLSGANDRSWLILYGTGIRGGNASVAIDGVACIVDYAGPGGGVPGLDQVNVELPKTLAGRGNVNITLAANNQAANVVSINIQ